MWYKQNYKNQLKMALLIRWIQRRNTSFQELTLFIYFCFHRIIKLSWTDYKGWNKEYYILKGIQNKCVGTTARNEIFRFRKCFRIYVWFKLHIWHLTVDHIDMNKTSNMIHGTTFNDISTKVDKYQFSTFQSNGLQSILLSLQSAQYVVVR